MLKSSEIALKFPEEKIPMLPGLENDNEVRGVLGLHIELTVFCDNDVEKFKEAAVEVLDDLNITEPEAQERVGKCLDKYEAFLKTLIAHLHEKGKVKGTSTGNFEYKAQPYIFFDDEEAYWHVDLEKLQDGDAKYDKLNLYEGQVVCIFNPTVRNGRLLVDTTGVNVRVGLTDHSQQGQSQSQMMQQFQQNLMNASQCTCNANPCTCGSAPPAGFDDDDDDDEETAPPENPYKEWDDLMSNANDRDVILVYLDGELDKRF